MARVLQRRDRPGRRRRRVHDRQGGGAREQLARARQRGDRRAVLPAHGTRVRAHGRARGHLGEPPRRVLRRPIRTREQHKRNRNVRTTRVRDIQDSARLLQRGGTRARHEEAAATGRGEAEHRGAGAQHTTATVRARLRGQLVGGGLVLAMQCVQPQ